VRAPLARLFLALALALTLGAFQPLRAEGEQVRLVVLEAESSGDTARADPALEIARRRLERMADGPVRIRRQGSGRVMVEIPVAESRLLVRNAFGIRPSLAIRPVAPEASRGDGTARRRNSEMVPVDPDMPLAVFEPELALRPAIALDESNVERAIASIDARTGDHVVDLRLDERGAEILSRMARDHVGERFAIVLDGKVVSALFVREAITGRVLRIEGGFSREDAARLSAALTGARLAMPFRIVEERVIERNREE